MDNPAAQDLTKMTYVWPEAEVPVFEAASAAGGSTGLESYRLASAL
jgi:hypothetical protein